MNVELVWQYNYTGRGVVVSILDDGIEHTHPDLRDNYVNGYVQQTGLELLFSVHIGSSC